MNTMLSFNICKESEIHPEARPVPYRLDEIFGEYRQLKNWDMINDLTQVVQKLIIKKQ